jgi:DNA-directed RNA polymerase subunit RPC12/RpoP
MEQYNIKTDLHLDILKHLFVDYPCHECGKRSAISLHMIHIGEQVLCPNCKKRFRPTPLGKPLGQFLLWYASLYAQLRKADLHLMFFHQPFATLWSQDDKSQDNT